MLTELLVNLALMMCVTDLRLPHAASISSNPDPTLEELYPLGVLDTLENSVDGASGYPGAADETEDCCAKWFDCSMNYEQEFKIIYNQLPACPCSVHPDFLPYEGKFFDDKHKRNFIWRDVTHLYSKIPRQDPAKWCIQQEPEQGSLSAQYCCYNNETALITRGSGAGTPRLISPSRFFEYHEKFDIQPWIDCKGDWTKYHAIRPPNNDLQCTQYPGEEEYQLQREQAQNY